MILVACFGLAGSLVIMLLNALLPNESRNLSAKLPRVARHPRSGQAYPELRS